MRINVFSIALFSLLMLIFSNTPIVFATTHYVANNGSDNNPGTKASPFATIQKAADIVNPGDTVIVKNGIYTDTNRDDKIVKLNRSGTSGKWITFRSENKWGAVLDGQNDNGKTFGFLFNKNVSYVRIENFEMKNMLRCVMVNHAIGTSNSNNIYIVGNLMHDTKISCMYFYTAVNKVTIESNVIYNVALPYTGDPKEGNLHHGIYTYGDDFKIYNNVIYGCPAGWTIQIAPTVEGIKIYNNSLDGSNPIRDGHIVIWRNPTDVVIENNIFNVPRKTAISCANHNTSKVIFRNNITSSLAKLDNSCDSGLFTMSGNKVGKDPSMTNPPNGSNGEFATYNFSLKPNSPAIDTGLSTNGLSVDINGNLRPKDGNGDGTKIPDIGAYEYLPKTINLPPNPPTNFKAQ